jgi:hypothetical protein
MPTQSWYQSTTIQGGLISLLVLIDQVFHLNIGGDSINTLIVGIFGVIGVAMTIYGRLTATKTTTVLGKSFN